MLIHPTVDGLRALRLNKMAAALIEQQSNPDLAMLGFEERLGLLVDLERLDRDNRRLKSRLKKARLRQDACIENLDYRRARGLDKALMARLATCSWLKTHSNVLITGKTGVGKSYIGCALANKACRNGVSAAYHRTDRLLQALSLGRADGRYPRLMKGLLNTHVLILDDFGLSSLNLTQCRELLEVIEDRHDRRSTIVCSQLPVAKWHGAMAEPTLADAILDRLVHNAYRLELKGGSLRKEKGRERLEADLPEEVGT